MAIPCCKRANYLLLLFFIFSKRGLIGMGYLIASSINSMSIQLSSTYTDVHVLRQIDASIHMFLLRSRKTGNAHFGDGQK